MKGAFFVIIRGDLCAAAMRSFDLADVFQVGQHRLDDFQQVLGGYINVFDVLIAIDLKPRVLIRQLDGLRKAEDRGQGRAQLMAHISKEFSMPGFVSGGIC